MPFEEGDCFQSGVDSEIIRGQISVEILSAFLGRGADARIVGARRGFGSWI